MKALLILMVSLFVTLSAWAQQPTVDNLLLVSERVAAELYLMKDVQTGYYRVEVKSFFDKPSPLDEIYAVDVVTRYLILNFPMLEPDITMEFFEENIKKYADHYNSYFEKKKEEARRDTLLKKIY